MELFFAQVHLGELQRVLPTMAIITTLKIINFGIILRALSHQVQLQIVHIGLMEETAVQLELRTLDLDYQQYVKEQPPHRWEVQ